ncbi:MAG: nucleoside hydrolase [Succinivibrio sp.]|nr:nucleoside hydrolase [Succinivibrio sp.]
MSPLIIDTDIGVDDAVALRYALLTQDLIGITCTYGNVAVEQAVKNAKALCRHYGVSQPVFKGASRPLSRRPLPLESHIHGHDGLGDYVTFPENSTAPDAVHYLIESAWHYRGELTLCTIGPLTNLALALNLCPELPSLLKEVIIMGGAFGSNGYGGNMTHFAEFNILNDPEAAELVLASTLNLVLIPLDVTMQVQISGEEIARLKDEFLRGITAFYLDFYLKRGGSAGMAVHDALTVSYLNNPGWYQTVTTPLTVSLGGPTDGQTLRPLGRLNVPHDVFAGRPEHKLCLGVQVAEVKEHLLKTLRLQ